MANAEPLGGSSAADAGSDEAWVVYLPEIGSWWRPNRSGYAASLFGAGIYSEKEAKLIEEQSDRGDSARSLASELERMATRPGTVAAHLAARPSGDLRQLNDARNALGNIAELVGFDGAIDDYGAFIALVAARLRSARSGADTITLPPARKRTFVGAVQWALVHLNGYEEYNGFEDLTRVREWLESIPTPSALSASTASAVQSAVPVASRSRDAEGAETPITVHDGAGTCYVSVHQGAVEVHPNASVGDCIIALGECARRLDRPRGNAALAQHVCGKQGFGRDAGDVCPACVVSSSADALTEESKDG